MAAFGPPRALS